MSWKVPALLLAAYLAVAQGFQADVLHQTFVEQALVRMRVPRNPRPRNDP